MKFEICGKGSPFLYKILGRPILQKKFVFDKFQAVKFQCAAGIHTSGDPGHCGWTMNMDQVQ
jgi:hypothetical protein